MPTVIDAKWDALRGMGYLGAMPDMTMDWLLQNTPIELLEEFTGIRWVYEFDGATMYATIPDWTPNGLPFEVSVEAVPLTVDANGRTILSHATSSSRYVRSISNAIQERWENLASAFPILSANSAIAQGAPVEVESANTASGTTLQANAVQAQDATGFKVDSAINPLSKIGADGPLNAAGYFHGPIWNLKLIDDSPIQDTTACVGDANRYVQLENPIVLEGDFEVEFDWIRQDQTGAGVNSLVSGGTNSLINIDDSGAAAPDRFRLITELGSLAVDNALQNVALGQHCAIKVVRASDNVDVLVDSVSVGGGVRTGAFAVQFFGTNKGAANDLPANAALQNVIIRDLTNNRTWEFKLDEGAGTDAPNTGTAQGNYLNQPLWNRATLDGDGTRYIEIPEFRTESTENVRIKGAWIRRDRTGTDRTFLLGDDTKFGSFVVAYDSGYATPNDFGFQYDNAAGTTWVGALTDIAQGQHFDWEVVAGSSTVELFINGESKGSQGLSRNVFLANVLCRANADRVLPSGSAIGNVILENLTTGDYVEYRIDEGSGIAVKAYDRDGNEIGDGANLYYQQDALFELEQDWTVNNGLLDKTGGSFGRAYCTDSLAESGKRYRVQGTVTKRGGGNVRLSVESGAALLDVSASGQIDEIVVADVDGRFNFNGGTFDGSVISTINEVPHGTITPDASWTMQPEYSNDGAWTPDADWQFFEDNSRYYPLSEGYGSGGVVEAYDLEGNPVPANNGAYQGYADGQWRVQQQNSHAQISTLWQLMLQSRGYGPQVNDGWFNLLGDLGYTGNLNDRELQFWLAGGTLPAPLPGPGTTTVPPLASLTTAMMGNETGYEQGSMGSLVPTAGDTHTVTKLVYSTTAGGQIRMRAEVNGGGLPAPDIFDQMTLDGFVYNRVDANFIAVLGEWRWPAQSVLLDATAYVVTFS